VLIFCGFLGVCFIYFITLVSSRNIYFKGWFFSVFSWFMLYALFTLFKVPRLEKAPWQTPTSNLIGASIFGITLAWIILKVETIAKASKASSSLQFGPAVHMEFDEMVDEEDNQKIRLREPDKIK
jgi:mannose/fructose/N-acetylgalactosamine-specific phosphotransferase system component IIC